MLALDTFENWPKAYFWDGVEWACQICSAQHHCLWATGWLKLRSLNSFAMVTAKPSWNLWWSSPVAGLPCWNNCLCVVFFVLAILYNQTFTSILYYPNDFSTTAPNPAFCVLNSSNIHHRVIYTLTFSNVTILFKKFIFVISIFFNENIIWALKSFASSYLFSRYYMAVNHKLVSQVGQLTNASGGKSWHYGENNQIFWESNWRCPCIFPGSWRGSIFTWLFIKQPIFYTFYHFEEFHSVPNFFVHSFRHWMPEHHFWRLSRPCMNGMGIHCHEACTFG